jgi:1-aminocyclopropane-1-carboxylate deaminase
MIMDPVPSKYLQLQRILADIPQHPYPCHSRIHPLNSWNTSSQRCFVKRDDELGFGISGSKIRKYRSLIPFFLSQKIEEVILIGSAHSNHVLGMTQLLIENRIKPTLFLKKPSRLEQTGNFLLTSLLLPSSSLYWVNRREWKEAEQLARCYASKQSTKAFVLPEGGSTEMALPGALSLPLDIASQNAFFDHIFMDSGTGLTAIALLLGLAWLEIKSLVHVVLMAGSSLDFLTQLSRYHSVFEKLLRQSCPFPQNFLLHQPSLAASFGSTNAALFQEMKLLAQAEGFLTDPIYSGKLFLTAKHHLATSKIEGNILIHHSGGGLSLFGFQEQLKKGLELTLND